MMSVQECSLLSEKVQNFLLHIGDSPSTVAVYLAGQGVRGYRSSASGCPIANLLRSVFPLDADYSFLVIPWGVGVYHDCRAVVTVSLPQAVRTFVQEFDQGAYPALRTLREPSYEQ